MEDDALRTVWKGAAVSTPILDLATTIHAVDDDTWAQMIADQQFEGAD